VLAEAKSTLVVRGAGPGAPASASVQRPALERRAPDLTPQDRQRAVGFVKKGEELMASGNVEAARLFYERAADAGLAQGALALAATFDPDELARRQVVGGLRPDPAAAKRWYERARELGADEADEPLRRLTLRQP
jgi:TPR repeat protein